MIEKLKPCPFCGKEIEVIRAECTGYYISHHLQEDNFCSCELGYTGLNTMEETTGLFETKEDAIKSWNTRYEHQEDV